MVRIKFDKELLENIIIELIIILVVTSIGFGIYYVKPEYPLILHICACFFIFVCDIVKIVLKKMEL